MDLELPYDYHPCLPVNFFLRIALMELRPAGMYQFLNAASVGDASMASRGEVYQLCNC